MHPWFHFRITIKDYYLLKIYYLALSLWTWAKDQLNPSISQRLTLKTYHLNELYTWARDTVRWHWLVDTFLTAVNRP